MGMPKYGERLLDSLVVERDLLREGEDLIPSYGSYASLSSLALRLGEYGLYPGESNLLLRERLSLEKSLLAKRLLAAGEGLLEGEGLRGGEPLREGGALLESWDLALAAII